MIEKYLEFHVPRFDEVFFHEHCVITETGEGFSFGSGQRLVEFVCRRHLAHSFAAAASGCFEQHWVSH